MRCSAFSESPSVSESNAERKIAFCNAYMGLLDFFKVTHTIQASVNKGLLTRVPGDAVADDAIPFLPLIPLGRAITGFR